jgi:choline dehydrogenase-like flavoprotein
MSQNTPKQERYSLAVVGTGFASTFFLFEYLKHAKKNERIVVLERGMREDPAVRLQQRATNLGIGFNERITNLTPQKGWVQNIAFGGGSCWTGNTPRMLPNDFKTHSLYGVGTDWPISYQDIEPYYVRVEDAMGIAGSAEGPFPRSKPYPFSAHQINAFDKVLATKYPGQHIPFPSARSSNTATGRPVCCGSGVCSICPISSKFQIDLHMAQVYEDPRITLLLESEVEKLDMQSGVVAGVQYKHKGKDQALRADLVAVGAHAIMTPFILLKSGLQDFALGRYLNEQIAWNVQVNLDGIDNFGGGQAVTGLGTMFMDGTFRKERPACLIENWNVPWLRAEHGRWRQRASLKFVFEDIPSADNRVNISPTDLSKPTLYYPKHSEYIQQGFKALDSMVGDLLKGLPVESYIILPMEDNDLGGSAHIQGTTRMGIDPATSVVDADLRHHKYRNLLVLGGGTFPTCPAANPTLTLSALSVRAAERLFT